MRRPSSLGRRWACYRPALSGCGTQPGGSTFSPLSLSPALWLKADGVLWQDSARTTLATADGDPVGAWDDASGNGRHLLQATSAKRPTLQLAEQNGLAVVSCDGVDDYLRYTGAVATQALTIVAVLKVNASNPAPIWDGSAADRAALYARASGANSIDSYALTTFISGTTSFAAYHEYSVVYNGASSSVSVDGTQVATGDPGSGGLSEAFNLGATGFDNAWSDTSFAEIVVLIGTPSVTALRAYLKAKWGTP